MDFMLSIVKPDFGVLTLIDKVHAHLLFDPDWIAHEKYKMIFASKRAVFLNKEDPYHVSALPALKVDAFIYLTRDKKFVPQKEADIWFEDYQLHRQEDKIFTTADVFVK